MSRATTAGPAGFDPRRLDASRLADSAQTLSGRLALRDFARLAQDLLLEPSDGREVRWSARVEWRSGGAAVAAAPWMHLSVQAVLPLTCQRCLGPVDTPVEVDRWFRFVPDEATAEAQDDDCEEDLLALDPRPDLLAVVEDELILASPLVPMHGVWAHAAHAPSGEEAPPSERPHPFAALARLKKPAE